jgi:LysM domain-containing protein
MAPTQLAGFMVAVLLASCAIGARFDPATGGPVATAPGEATPAQPASVPRGRAYLFRGFAGLIFSLGTDRLAERIERAGFTATVNEAVMCSAVANEAVRNYRQDPAPVTVIGHSMGAACALNFAGMLAAENIPVSLLVTTDPARISGDVPLNVERYINIFQSNSLLGGRDVMPAKGFQGHYASFDLVEHNEISHVNMEKAESIHDQVVTKIEQLGTTPAKSEGETEPIRFVVPADAALELWDSGMPVFARAGDTLQTLAMFYHVPLWSLTQINRTSGRTALTPGQRIIVPRHLLPRAASDTGSISGKAPAKH